MNITCGEPERDEVCLAVKAWYTLHPTPGYDPNLRPATNFNPTPKHEPDIYPPDPEPDYNRKYDQVCLCLRYHHAGPPLSEVLAEVR